MLLLKACRYYEDFSLLLSLLLHRLVVIVNVAGAYSPSKGLFVFAGTTIVASQFL